MKNPPWHRDEIILALDLYFKLKPGEIHNKNVAIVALSEVLNKLPIFKIRPDELKFRNPNGVSLKLSNFLAIDPGYSGKGMNAYSALDKATFFEFEKNKEILGKVADTIKETVANKNLSLQLYEIGEEMESDFVVMEGQVIYRLHKLYERNSKIVNEKKKVELNKKGLLECEACTFDFQKGYGKLGEGYIECHHRTPLHNLGEIKATTLDDLALVCSNCHRMLHRDLSHLSVEALKEKLSRKPILYSFSN